MQNTTALKHSSKHIEIQHPINPNLSGIPKTYVPPTANNQQDNIDNKTGKLISPAVCKALTEMMLQALPTSRRISIDKAIKANLAASESFIMIMNKG